MSETHVPQGSQSQSPQGTQDVVEQVQKMLENFTSSMQELPAMISQATTEQMSQDFPARQLANQLANELKGALTPLMLEVQATTEQMHQASEAMRTATEDLHAADEQFAETVAAHLEKLGQWQQQAEQRQRTVVSAGRNPGETVVTTGLESQTTTKITPARVPQLGDIVRFWDERPTAPLGTKWKRSLKEGGFILIQE